MSLDTDGDDSVSVDELLTFASQATLRKIEELFALIDPNNGGEIQTTDFLLIAQTDEKVIRFFQEEPSLAMLANPSTYINDLMELDVDNDGSISIDEMYDFMCRRAFGINRNAATTTKVQLDDTTKFVFLEEMDTRQYIRSMFDQFQPDHCDVVTAATFVRAIEINVRVQTMLKGRHYLNPLLHADDLEGLCKEIDRDGDGMITIDEVLYFARTLGAEQEKRKHEQHELEVEKKSIPENEDLNQFEKIEQDELEVEKVDTGKRRFKQIRND